jgi:hypothetical protein
MRALLLLLLDGLFYCKDSEHNEQHERSSPAEPL